MIRFSPLRTCLCVRGRKERMKQGMTRRWKHAPMRGEKRCTRWKLLRRRKHAPMRAGEAELGGVGEVAPRACAHAGGSGLRTTQQLPRRNTRPCAGAAFLRGLFFS